MHDLRVHQIKDVIKKHLLAGAATQGPVGTSGIPDGPGMIGDDVPTIAGCPGAPGPVPAGHTGMQDGRARGGGGVCGIKRGG